MDINRKKNATIIIIGAGIAGMSASMHLLKQGVAVEVYEATNHVGGRCYSYFDDKIQTQVCQKLDKELDKSSFWIDNGQHLFSGAYTEFEKLIEWLETDSLMSTKSNINVDFIDAGDNQIYNYNLNCSKLGFSNSLSFLFGILKNRAISISDKINFIKSATVLLLDKNYLLKNNISSVHNLLNMFNFSSTFITRLWKPMVVAMLNVSLENASAEIFLNTIKKLTFSGRNSLSLTHSLVPINKLFQNFERKISKSYPSKLVKNTRISSLIIENNVCKGVITHKKEFIHSDYVISTLPPHNLAKVSLQFSKYEKIFPASCILSCYLWLEHPIDMPKYLCIVQKNIEWIFDINAIRKNDILSCNNNADVYLYSITISNANRFNRHSHTRIISIIKQEIDTIFSTNINILAYKIINIKNGTPLITSENAHLRPHSETMIKSLYLAGDWTDTTLPATAESAAISGGNAAHAALQ